MRKFDIGGVEVEWTGVNLTWMGGVYSVPFAHTPSTSEIKAVLLGWENGYRYALNVGRETLRNDFRNLMGLDR